MEKSVRILFMTAVIVAALSSCHKNDPYYFNGPISEEVLNNYLSKAITLSEFLTVDPYCNDGKYPDKDADLNYILNTGTKFVGRAIYRWGDESALNEPGFWEGAKGLIAKVHAVDPDVIFQAAVFEEVSTEVCSIKIPDWTFRALGLPVEDRNFHYADMVFRDGKYNNWWGEGNSVPDIRNFETQLWLMYLIGSYVDAGCEAIHLGQVWLMGDQDEGLQSWTSFLSKVRAYVYSRARRHFVLFDAHGGRSGLIVDGKSLLDYNAYPLRIKEIPEEPLGGKLEMGYSDSIFGFAKACETPAGWHTDALPYIVEFDNFGLSARPGECGVDTWHIWGYDEISWFWLLPHEKKCEWLDYAWNWLRENDPAGHLQMPGARVVTLPGEPVFMSRAVSPTDSIKYGMGIEEKVKEIFAR